MRFLGVRTEYLQVTERLRPSLDFGDTLHYQGKTFKYHSVVNMFIMITSHQYLNLHNSQIEAKVQGEGTIANNNHNVSSLFINSYNECWCKDMVGYLISYHAG